VKTGWCRIARIGNEYLILQNDPEFKGLIQDLCIEEWNLLLDNLADQIIDEALKVTYKLSRKANPPKGFEVVMGGKISPVANYDYNPDTIPNSIENLDVVWIVFIVL